MSKLARVPCHSSRENLWDHGFGHYDAHHDPDRGKPLLSYQVIVSLIAATTTQAGLRVEAALDRNTYPAGVKVPDAELKRVNLKPARFHGDWNYTVVPHPDP
jgi:hypothetical protein